MLLKLGEEVTVRRGARLQRRLLCGYIDVAPFLRQCPACIAESARPLHPSNPVQSDVHPGVTGTSSPTSRPMHSHSAHSRLAAAVAEEPHMPQAGKQGTQALSQPDSW